MLTHWTKKIIIEEGHTLAQLVHMLQLLVRHYKVYYPVRHHLIQHMVTSVQRLGFTPNASIDHKKIAVDLAEVIIRWELQRIRDDADGSSDSPSLDPSSSKTPSSKTPSSKPPSLPSTDSCKPVEKVHSDAIVNFLLRLACHVNESAPNLGSAGELLSRRCVTLLKIALKTDVWPNAEVKLNWFDKLLSSVESGVPNYGNICTALELLNFLLTILRKEAVLVSFKPLQKGISLCMFCNNTKVIRSLHNLLTRLMMMYPIENFSQMVTPLAQGQNLAPSSGGIVIASKHEELDQLYTSVNKAVIDGLTNYEKSAIGSASPTGIFSTLMILKAACSSNSTYLDKIISSFFRVLSRMTRDHLQINPSSNDASGPMGVELLILALDLIKNRVGVLGNDMRKAFIAQILVALIEKSSDVKVLKAITKMVEDWIKSSKTGMNQSSNQPSNQSSNLPSNQPGVNVTTAPTIREKILLLVKLMLNTEKRFPEETELNANFLELVNYIYREESFKSTDLTVKLEQAFMTGLRCSQPLIRAKFFEVFDASIRKRLIDR